MSAFTDLSLPLLPDMYYHIFNRGIDRQDIFFRPENYRFFLLRYGEYMVDYVDTYAFCLLSNHFHFLIKVKSHEDILKAASRDFDTIDKGFYNRYVLPWLNRSGIDSDRSHVCHAHKQDFTVLRELLDLLTLHPPNITANLHEVTHPEQVDFKTQLCSHLVSERLRRFMLSYAKAINKGYGRTGSLLQKAFRRKIITHPPDLIKVATYIHHNVIHHGYSFTYRDYDWSSYRIILSTSDTKLDRSTLIDWFGSVEDFKLFSETYKLHKWQQEQFYIEE